MGHSVCQRNARVMVRRALANFLLVPEFSVNGSMEVDDGHIVCIHNSRKEQALSFIKA